MIYVKKPERVTRQGMIEKLRQNLIDVSDEDAKMISHLSQKRLGRLSLLINNLQRHQLLSQESFQKTLGLVALKLPAVTVSAHTKQNLENGKKVTLDSGVTVFFRNQKNFGGDFKGSYGKVIKGYAHPDDAEPAWAVKKLNHTKSLGVFKKARREVKYLRHAGMNAFFYTTKYSVKIVMDWQKGQSLDELTKSTEFLGYSFARKLKIMVSILSEVMRLYEILRVHDDTHDMNIIVNDDKAVLIDYGKARGLYKSDGDLRSDNLKIYYYITNKYCNRLFEREWQDLTRVDGMAVKLLNDALHSCTIAQAHAYCQMLLDNLDGLNHKKLHEIAAATINRSELTVDDVLHGKRGQVLSYGTIIN